MNGGRAVWTRFTDDFEMPALYKTAWFMSHRIREAMRDVSPAPLGGPTSSGIVEADKTYLGKTKGRGRGPRREQHNAVVALVERKGRARAFHVPAVTAATLKPLFLSEITKSSINDRRRYAVSKARETFRASRFRRPLLERVRAR